jgi:hypothetical protein
MKHAILLILALSVVPSVIAQQEYSYKERIYIFSIDFNSGVPAVEECAVALDGIRKRLQITGIDPINGTTARFKIDSVDTSASEGVVTNMADEEIGDMLICQDTTTYPPEMNVSPIYNEVNVSGTKFRVEGGGLNPNFLDQLPGGLVQYSPPGYPAPGVEVINVNGTVLPSTPGKRGGSYMESTLSVDGDSSAFPAGGNAIVVLRVLLPVSS